MNPQAYVPRHGTGCFFDGCAMLLALPALVAVLLAVIT